MSNSVISSDDWIAEQRTPRQNLSQITGKQGFESNLRLPNLITWTASKQTYYTIRWLVDRDRVLDAYRAYAYYRWVDDRLDQKLSARHERLAFMQRQQVLMKTALQGAWLDDLSAEERMLVDLIQSDHEPVGGLQSYIRNMMAVMVFDADRRGRLISQQELTDYSCHLSTAVTEALHYFIGHDAPTPRSEARYLAVTGAHITHMLRDTFEDIAAGYFNIPCEFLAAHDIGASDVQNDAYRTWVEHRVQLARNHFAAGKDYLAQVRTFRCRMAGYAYTARFESVLTAIEKEGYQLRPVYHERKSLRGGMGMSWSILSMMLKGCVRGQS